MDGISGAKILKEKKKNGCQEVENNGQKAETREVTRNNKEQPPVSRPSTTKTRRRSADNLTVPTIIVSYAQVNFYPTTSFLSRNFYLQSSAIFINFILKKEDKITIVSF